MYKYTRIQAWANQPSGDTLHNVTFCSAHKHRKHAIEEPISSFNLTEREGGEEREREVEREREGIEKWREGETEREGEKKDVLPIKHLN